MKEPSGVIWQSVWMEKIGSSYLWHPSKPNLFDAVLTLRKGDRVLDRVETYFGMREVSCREGMVLINKVPFFQKLILDQGYWEASLLTPPDDDAVRRDIELAMIEAIVKAGFFSGFCYT